MHNIHFIVVRTDSAEDAMEKTRNLIENSYEDWFQVCWAVSENNEKTLNLNEPEGNEYFEYLTSIEDINNFMNDYITEQFEQNKRVIDDFVRLWYIHGYSKETLINMWNTAYSMRFIEQTKDLIVDKGIDVIKHGFYDNNFSEVGVTHDLSMCYSKDTIYVVVVNVHS